MIWIELIGFIAAILTTAAGIPEVIKVTKTKHTRDLSLPMIGMLLSGVFMWLLYGIFINSWPIILANTVTFSLWGKILILKLKYK